MRITRIAVGLALMSMALMSGCRCEVTPIQTCGDGVCDSDEGSECSDCTFEPGESLNTSVASSDYLSSQLQGAFGISEADVLGAFAVAKPMNTYDFNDWCGAGCSTTWIGAYFMNPGSMTIRASGDRDWLMVCEAPDGTLFANDDFDTADCLMNGNCDPGIIIMGAGTWLCIFGASPFTATNPDPYGAMTISTK